MTERWVRICKVHRLELLEDGDQLRCPKCQGPVDVWLTVDREKGLVVSESDKEIGELSMLREKVRTTPAAPTPRRTPSPPTKGEAMRTRGPGTQTLDAMEAAAAPPTGRPGKGLVDRMKFGMGKKTLWVRLRFKKPKIAEQHGYRIEWTLIQGKDTKKRRTQGIRTTAPSEPVARKAYEDAIYYAKKLGWKEVSKAPEQKLVFREIPTWRGRAK